MRCVLVLVLVSGLVAGHEARLSQYIGHFEPLHYPTIDLSPVSSSRSKRSTGDLENDLSPLDSHRYHRHRQMEDRTASLDFDAMGRRFQLRLQPDSRSVFSHDLIVEGGDGQPVDLSLDHLFSGQLLGDHKSHVFGSIRDGIFEGSIVTPNATYYVERAHRYFPGRNTSDRSSGEGAGHDSSSGTSPSFHSVIYSSNDVKHPLIDKSLGSGCASSHDPEVREWMKRVSESGEKVRSRRSAGDEDEGRRFERQSSGRPSFSQSSRDHPKDDNIWMRNAHARISLDRKDFLSGPSVTNSQYPSSTVKRRACSLYIQTDTYLWEHIRREASTDSKAREEISSLVAQHIKAVNHIYENSDFSGIRGLKFIVQRLRINDSSSCDTPFKKEGNPFCSPNIDVSNFLNLNSQFNHNDFCLAYIFTYRDFSGGTLGLAWVASTSGASGGICEKYKSYTENIHGRQVQTKRSLNTGIITFVNYNSRVPPKVSELTLAHEIGHNFGSPHDFPADCRPGSTQGNYIMYSSATSGERPNNNKFSPCSVRNISSVLQAVFGGEGKENCFQEDDGPFCGNKIVEEGEECDCGYDQKECTEQCCYPREVEPYLESDPQAKPCTRRRGAICSPSEGPCCSERCRYEPNHKLCREDRECTFKSNCNGYRAACPAAPPKPNKTECNGGTQVCWSGSCVGSICQKYDMEECFLTSRSGAKSDEMCEVACQKSGDMFSCRRTSEIAVMRNISGLKLRPGSPCNDFQGYCDVFQRCRAVDAEGPLAMLKNLLFNEITLMTIQKWTTTYWWACVLMLVGVAIFMAAFVKCCAVHTPSSNPNKKPALRISDTLQHTLRRKPRRPRQSQSRGGAGHSQSGQHSAGTGTAAPNGPAIPMQSASAADHMPIPPHLPLPPLPPTSQSGTSHQSSNACPSFQVHQQSTSFTAVLPQNQLVVSLPPEHRSGAYLPEPPPPYPGHPPSIPPRPTRPPAGKSAPVPGPSHGYGEGRGHYNRRSNQQHVPRIG